MPLPKNFELIPLGKKELNIVRLSMPDWFLPATRYPRFWLVGAIGIYDLGGAIWRCWVGLILAVHSLVCIHGILGGNMSLVIITKFMVHWCRLRWLRDEESVLTLSLHQRRRKSLRMAYQQIARSSRAAVALSTSWPLSLPTDPPTDFGVILPPLYVVRL